MKVSQNIVNKVQAKLAPHSLVGGRAKISNANFKQVFFILSWLKMQINTKNLLYDFFTPFHVTTGKMSTLTLSYSSEGSLALSVFRHHEL